MPAAQPSSSPLRGVGAEAPAARHLGDAELRYRALVESLPHRVFFKDCNSVFVCVNSGFARDLGLSAEDLAGKSDFDLFPAGLAQKYRNDDQAVLMSRQARSFEEVNVANGQTRIVSVTKTPVLGEDGEAVGLLGVFTDITEQRRTEAALAQERNFLRALIENSTDRIFFKDAGSRFVWCSLSLVRRLGRQRPDELIGRTDFDFHPEAFARETFATEQEVIRSGAAQLNRIEQRAHEDGAVTWSSVSRVPIRDDDGKVIGLIGISRDITELKFREEQLKDLATRLEQNNRELQDFAYVASHDLQEPLRKIQAFGDRLKVKCAAQLGDQGRDYLERMQNAAGRMQVLIDDLLAYSRVTTRAQPFVPTDLNGIVADVLSDLEVRIEQTGATVTCEPLPIIEADAIQMRQLFQNLIGNALKFHRKDVPPVVRIRALAPATEVPEAAAMCQILVEDNGIGFEEKYLDRIFVVFQRLHGRAEYEGTGVGLAICRKIALRHGGDITARSQLGEGATFIVTLPAHHPKEEHLP